MKKWILRFVSLWGLAWVMFCFGYTNSQIFRGFMDSVEYKKRDDWSNLRHLRRIQCCDCGLVHDIHFCKRGRQSFIAFALNQKRTVQVRKANGQPHTLDEIVGCLATINQSLGGLISTTQSMITSDQDIRWELIELQSFVSIMVSDEIECNDEELNLSFQERAILARNCIDLQRYQREPNFVWGWSLWLDDPNLLREDFKASSPDS